LHIPLTVRTETGEGGTQTIRPFVVCMGKANGCLFRAEFLVDTGGPCTFIGNIDFSRIRRAHLGHRSRTIRIGGQKIKIHDQGHTVLKAGTDTRQVVDIEVSRMYACPPGGDPLPSILGVDMLRDNELILLFNAAKRTGCLYKGDWLQAAPQPEV